MKTYNYLEPVTPANTQEKTMVQLENQAYTLTEKNWRRKNTWESSEASRAAKNGRDKLICRAYMSAAAKHLTAKAKNIDKHLSVWPLSDMSGLVLDYNIAGEMNFANDVRENEEDEKARAIEEAARANVDEIRALEPGHAAVVCGNEIVDIVKVRCMEFRNDCKEYKIGLKL